MTQRSCDLILILGAKWFVCHVDHFMIFFKFEKKTKMHILEHWEAGVSVSEGCGDGADVARRPLHQPRLCVRRLNK